jgi:hypothetical protein
MCFERGEHRAAHVEVLAQLQKLKESSASLSTVMCLYRWSAVVRGAVDTGYRRNHTGLNSCGFAESIRRKQ